jgi:hypothetical protein
VANSAARDVEAWLDYKTLFAPKAGYAPSPLLPSPPFAVAISEVVRALFGRSNATGQTEFERKRQARVSLSASSFSIGEIHRRLAGLYADDRSNTLWRQYEQLEFRICT